MSYGVAPTSARPFTRPGDPEAHLVELGDQYALCGRPAGGRRDKWKPAEVTPMVKTRGRALTPDRPTRCADCDLVMRASNPRSWEPRYWWRASCRA